MTMAASLRRRPSIVGIAAISIALSSIGTVNASSSKGIGGGVFQLPQWQWQQGAPSPSETESSSPPPSSTDTPPRGGGAVAKHRIVQKGSASSFSSPSKKGTSKKMMKKKVLVKRKSVGASVPMLPEGGKNNKNKSNNNGATATSASSVETMPSIFRIPSEEKYDRYAAALAVTEGLRRVRDAEIAGAAATVSKKKSVFGRVLGTSRDETYGEDDTVEMEKDATVSVKRNSLDAAKQRAESAFLLQSTKAVKALGMTIPQFNQIGREVLSDPALKERVSEQAYLYRIASAVNLEKVPLLDDPSSAKLLQSTEHKKHRVQLFARSVHEIEELRSDQMEALRQSLQVERFPPGFDLSDPNVQPLLHPEVRRVCEKFPVQAEEIVKRYGLDSDEFNRMLEETRGNPIFRWRVQKYVQRAEEEEKTKKTGK
ncbi:hypothetical protein ACHAXH_009410 [Discostella pseudostelligera]